MNLTTWMNALRRLGLAGAMGLLLLVGAAWVHRVWLPQQVDQAGQAGSEARRLRHELLAQAEPTAAVADPAQHVGSPEQAWQTLWQALPVAEQRVALQAEVLSSAQTGGLQVQAVQYRGQRQTWAVREGTALWRQRMLMPVEGRYPAVRAWLVHLLAEPALSVDEIDIQRPDPSSDQVKVRVGVSLWWRQAEEALP